MFVATGATFTKGPGGIIYGQNGGANANKADNGNGHAVYWGSGSYYNNTIGIGTTVRIP